MQSQPVLIVHYERAYRSMDKLLIQQILLHADLTSFPIQNCYVFLNDVCNLCTYGGAEWIELSLPFQRHLHLYFCNHAFNILYMQNI